MKYFDTKKGSLEEAISKAINEDNRPSAKDLLEAGGKYMKYSDLLLQKGRLMQQNKNTAMIDKEISKEMKKLGIKEATGDKEKYQKFFQSALKKFGVDSPADLDGEKKKEFFNYVDKNYKGDHEEEVGLDEGAPRKPLKKMSVRDVSKDVDGIKKGKELRIDGVKNPSELVKQLKDKYGSKIKAYVGPTNITVAKEEVDLEEADIKIVLDNVPDKDFDKFVKTNKLKTRYDFPGASKVAGVNSDEIEVSGDKRAIEKLLKLRNNDSLSNYKLNSRTKTYESNNLEAKTTKDVDETLDKIREANVEKGRNMRNILADIWKMNEGKSPFQKEEELTTGQKKLPPALQKAIKDKQGKKEEDEKSSKTATGQKPTKVEIEPEVK